MKTIESFNLTSSEVSVIVSALYSRARWFVDNYSLNDIRVYKSTCAVYLAIRSSLRSLGYGFLLKDIKLKRSL